MTTSLDSYVIRFADVLDRSESAFVATGSFKAKTSFTLQLDDGTKVSVVHSEMKTSDAALRTLLDRSTPAKFGEGKKTKVDPTVRSGRQILARAPDSGLSVSGFDARTLFGAIKKELALDEATELRAELYGLNIYERGGRFVRHKDTPSGKEMIGTLVVCLPWSFEGGELELAREGSAPITIDWGRDTERSPKSGVIAWAAFFGDVDHEIHEVTGGNRVTLTYRLELSAPAAKKPTKQKKEDKPSSRQELDAIFEELARESFEEGIGIRFPCLHLYPVDATTPAITNVDSAKALTLKGRDADIAGAALGAGFEVSLCYCLVARSEDGGEIVLNARLAKPPSAKELKRITRVVKQSTGSDDDGSSDTERELEALSDDQGETMWSVGEWDHSILVGEGYYSGTGYYGNEASAVDYYVGAALDVTRGGVKRGTQRFVRHAKFGRGTVLETLEGGRLRIRFEESGEEKTLMDQFVKPD